MLTEMTHLLTALHNADQQGCLSCEQNPRSFEIMKKKKNHSDMWRTFKPKNRNCHDQTWDSAILTMLIFLILYLWPGLLLFTPFWSPHIYLNVDVAKIQCFDCFWFVFVFLSIFSCGPLIPRERMEKRATTKPDPGHHPWLPASILAPHEYLQKHHYCPILHFLLFILVLCYE